MTTNVDIMPKTIKNMFKDEVILTDKQKLRIELTENKGKMKKLLKTMTPTDIFQLFDEDDSGLISYEEFRKMLPYLDIKISDAKAFRYFKLCDSDGSGEIDIDEFKVALFVCDPTSGNPVGYQPSENLTPIDAFELLDNDAKGFLDEDQFRYAVEYLQIPINEEVLENLFYQFDYNYTGKIDYFEFRDIFIEICDLRKELEDRGIDVPSFIRKKTMKKLLREVFLEEEIKEKKAIAEAKRYKQWILDARECKKIAQKAEFRSYQELRSALDLGGHVYVIGSGAHRQFSSPGFEKLETKKFEFEFFEKVIELWKDRVDPQNLIDRLKMQRKAEAQDADRDAERELSGLAKISRTLKNKALIDPYEEALNSAFLGLNVSLNTASLWGRRVHQVAASENVLFALSDTGEVFTWGGNAYWWDEIQPDSLYQTKWRGDTTARSQLLMGTLEKQLPPDASLEQTFDLLSPEDKKVEMIKVVAKYYNVWEPPPNPAQRMLYLEKEILGKISYDALKFSLQCRGKLITEKTKVEMVDDLYADIMLEKKLLGERAHKAIREIEVQVTALQKRKKTKLANKFLKRIEEMWLPLREVQAENRSAEISKEIAVEQERQYKLQSSYLDWRGRVSRKREDMTYEYTPRGNSLQINLIGATPRASEVVTPRGYQAAIQIAAGTAHACLVHKSGKLYSWGIGSAGRLGLDLTEKGDPQADTSKPRLVQALSERSVVRVSCGHSHTAAIVSGFARNELYLWGSTANGKCGLGSIVSTEECYCSVPTRVLVGPEDRSIKKISCGSGHSAAITENGLLYVFGCGDGGRLGLGTGNFATRYEPTLVENLAHEKIASVSCGNSTTIVSTEINHEWVGGNTDNNERFRGLKGGNVYIAGSRNVFGENYEVFTKLNIKSMDDTNDTPIAIKQVSAGYLHSALVSAEGELYCWGHNRTGCCGAPLAVRFLDKPTAVKFSFTRPSNLALHKKAYQSSTYNMREAKYAVNGKKEGSGVNKSSCTQQESQPWIEIDLGNLATIDKILIWNRTDEPKDRNESQDLYTVRLFPCWVIIGRDPFQKFANVISLKENLRNAVCKAKLTENKRCSTWRCPAKTQGRYVRVQLEKFNTLSVAEIEVYGSWGVSSGVGRVSFATAGRDVTVAVIRPSTDPRDVELMYKRAAYSDSANADILRQYETYVLEYDKFGRGEMLAKMCSICKGQGHDKCESCIFYETFTKEIKRMPPVIGGRRRRVKSITDYLIELNKPELQPIEVIKSTRPSKFQLRMETLFGDKYKKFNIMNLFRSAKSNYITPKEALSINPEEMMARLTYVQKIDDNKIRLKERELKESMQNGNSALIEEENLDEFLLDEATVEDNESQSELKNSVDTSKANLDSYSLLPPSSIGDSIVKHGYGTNKGIKVGDILPTGHKVKTAYPKSIAEQVGDKYKENQEWVQEKEKKEQEKKDADEKKKKMNLFGNKKSFKG